MYNTIAGYNMGRRPRQYRRPLVRGRRQTAPLNRRIQITRLGYRNRRIIRSPRMAINRRRYAAGFARMARRFPVRR